MLRKILSFCFCLCLCFTQIALAQELTKPDTTSTPTVKVAILPVITANKNYPQVNEFLKSSLIQEMHVPLNDTLQTVEYLDDISIHSAMQKANFTYNQNLDTLKDTADILSADIVVGYSVPTMYENYVHTFALLDDGPVLNSYLSVRLWVYCRPVNKIFVLSDKRQYLDEYSNWGTLPELAKDASLRLERKAELKSLLKQSIKIKKGES